MPFHRGDREESISPEEEVAGLSYVYRGEQVQMKMRKLQGKSNILLADTEWLILPEGKLLLIELSLELHFIWLRFVICQ